MAHNQLLHSIGCRVGIVKGVKQLGLPGGANLVAPPSEGNATEGNGRQPGEYPNRGLQRDPSDRRLYDTAAAMVADWIERQDPQTS